jgi:hypothetical protein
MSEEFQHHHLDVIDRFIERHKVLSVAAAVALTAVVLESENFPAISAPVAAVRHVLHV